MTEILAAIGLVALSLPLIFVVSIAAIAWRSWWLYPAYGWFLVPLGMPMIRFWHFAALLLLIDTLKTSIDTKKDERKTEWPAVVVAFFWPVAAWAMLRWLR